MKNSIFTRSTVNGDIYVIKVLLLAILHICEVITVDGSHYAIGKMDVPFETACFDEFNVISFFIKE